MKDIAIRFGEALFDNDEEDNYELFLNRIRNDPELKEFVLNTLKDNKEVGYE